MKYNDKNKPLVCMMTQSTCYKGTRKFTPKGILWHDTGANNPTLKRYVQPDDNASNRAELIEKLGKNQYNNDWNHIDRQAGMNCWIGKLADGTVATVQTMPWDFRPWGCGSGSKGSCNDTHIQFEICEDGKTDRAYLEAAYREACEITAYLCKMFGIDPHGTIDYKGIKVPTILCHQDSYKLGLGGNHSDIYDWFPQHGKSMETVRDDVAALLAGDGTAATPTEPVVAMPTGLTRGDKGAEVKAMQTMLIACGYSCGPDGADGDFGKNTLAGLQKFQAAAGLTVSGVYDEKTRAALEKTYTERPTTSGLQATALKALSDAEVIQKVGPLFTADQQKSGVLASVSLAQFILESGYGKSELAQNANNCFGMKKSLSGNTWSGSTWDGSVYTKQTKEQNTDGSYVTVTADFRKYACVENSIADHSAYLLGAKKGESLRYEGLKGCADYRKAARIIKDGGYATSLTYVDNLCNIIERWHLIQYDVLQPAIATEPSEPAPVEPEKTVELSATQAKYINSTGTHYISNSGSDENGAYRGGQAGDQTGTEWRMRSWYNRPWSCVLRYPDQRVALKIAQLAIDAVLNDRIGYDQSQNRTYLNQLKAVGWEPSKITVACEADCSAGVCANVSAAGYLLGIKALQNHTGTYTGNMRSALTKAGFQLLTDSKYLTGGDYLLPGDILLNDGHHTATNVTVGKKVKADWKPGVATTTEQTTPTATQYYRVRTSWEEKSSQVGAFVILQNAIMCAQGYGDAYKVYDESGKQVWPETAKYPYRVQITIPDLNYRMGPSTSYQSYGYIEPGVYTIVDEQDGWGLLKAYAEKRNGWVSLKYTTKL